MYLYPENLPAGCMPKTQGSTWQEKVHLVAGKSPSQMEVMNVQIFQGTARWVHLSMKNIIIMESSFHDIEIYSSTKMKFQGTYS